MTTTCGLFGARSDHRGLATLTALMHRHLRPAKTMVIDLSGHSPTAFHGGMFGWGATTIDYAAALEGSYDLDAWLDGLDVVLAFEIPYDPRLFDRCRARGVRTVCMVFAELDPWVRHPGLPRPDVVALPNSWMAERYPGCPILPVPVERFTPVAGGLVVHPGALAMLDRNGTRVVIDASEQIEAPVVVRGQVAPELPWLDAQVEVADLADGRDLYAGAALAVIPRRYGGMSLTIHEALGAGLPLLTTAAGPYAEQLPSTCLLPVAGRRMLRAKGGDIVVHDVDPQVLAVAVNTVMGDETTLRRMRAAAHSFAAAHSWENVAPAWWAALGCDPSDAQDDSQAATVHADTPDAETARIRASAGDVGV